MDTLLLEAAPRKKGERNNALRSSGRIPAIYYGAGQPTTPLHVEYRIFRKLFEKAGENTIIHLNLDGKQIPVLVHDIQFDPISDLIQHVDFIHVDMQKEVTTSVKIHVVGIAPAVKNLGGVLDLQKHEIKIKCLPKDLIHGIEVDVTGIVDFHTSVHVKDLKVPATIKILDNPGDTVVTATPQKAEVEEAPTPTAAEVAAASGLKPEVAGAEGTPLSGAAPAETKEKESKK